MTINVYYATKVTPWDKHGALYFEEPKLVSKEFSKRITDDKAKPLLSCPAYMDSTKNLFSVKSMYDVNFKIDENQYPSSDGYKNPLPQDFFDNHMTYHSFPNKLFSISQNVIFIADNDSLEMTQIHPYYDDSRWSKDVSVISGTFDIAQYYRQLEVPFIMHNDTNEISINEGDPLYYVKFHTNEPIKLIPFYWSLNFENLIYPLSFTHKSYHKWRPMQWYYNRFKKSAVKKLLISEIKKSLKEGGEW